uniref:A-kinase anchor protein 2 C-terminal domain-containing protein n=1 Tax=Hucho hucho TaxID=62062 RepID=A0A4W5MK69_9TELE
MATMEPVANRQSSANSLDEWASEVWGTEEGEMDPTLAEDTTHPPHPLVKQAPRTKSEDLGSESPDAPEPRPQVSPSSENLTDSTNKMAEVVPKMEQASSAEGAPETQPYPLEEEEEEEETIDCISDGKVEVISDPVEEEMSSYDSQGSQEWPSRSHLDDVVKEDKEEEDGAKEDKVEESQSVEMMENGAVRLEWNTECPANSELEQGLSETVCATEQASVEGGPVETSSRAPSEQVADKQKVSECPISSDREKTMPDNINHDTMKATETSTTTHSPLKRESSGDIFSESPENPESAFASDGEENQRVDSKPLDISSARRQWVRLDSTSSKPPQPEQSTSFSSSSCSHLVDLAQPQGVVTPDKQQVEQLLRNVTAALTHHGQEVAAQQVFKGATPAPPLATVTKEPANQVKADLLGSGCVVVKEQAGGEREEGKKEGDNRQTGGERGQRASGLGAAGEVDRKKKEKRSEETRTNPGLLMSRDSHSKASKMKLGGDLFDDSQSDSGVSAGFSPDSTVELQTTTSTPDSPPTLTSPPADETPIEREIRRAVQREQSLRRSRGLHNKPPTQEYVDIPLRKSVLTETLPSKSDKSQGGKDRQFAGKKMQKEISVETQREQVLVQLGKVRGSYDKGTVRQLKERKKLFEAFQEPKETSSMILSQSKAPSWASASDLSSLEIQGNDANVSFVGGSFGERRSNSLELMSQNQSPSGTPKGITSTPHGAPVPRGPTLSESTGGQIIILDNHHHLVLPAPAHVHHVSKPLRHSHSTGTLTETQDLTVVDSASIYSSTSALSIEEGRGFWRDEDGGRMDQEEKEEEEEEEVPKENPFFKLRSSSVSQDKVEQDIREAREREKELRRQRSSLYGGGGGVGRPASREVQSPTSPPPPPPLLLKNGLATPELSVTPSLRTASATPTARQSLGKLGMWPPPQTDEYPDSQSEGLQSPRTPRQKTPLLQRWESGQVMNGHGGEEED